MSDDDLIDKDHRAERAFKPDRYRSGQWQQALKILAKDNVRWRQVSEADFIEIVGVDDVKRHLVLKDIALELKHDKDELDTLEESIRAALDKARIRPAHWFD